ALEVHVRELRGRILVVLAVLPAHAAVVGVAGQQRPVLEARFEVRPIRRLVVAHVPIRVDHTKAILHRETLLSAGSLYTYGRDRVTPRRPPRRYGREPRRPPPPLWDGRPRGAAARRAARGRSGSRRSARRCRAGAGGRRAASRGRAARAARPGRSCRGRPAARDGRPASRRRPSRATGSRAGRLGRRSAGTTRGATA